MVRRVLIVAAAATPLLLGTVGRGTLSAQATPTPLPIVGRFPTPAPPPRVPPPTRDSAGPTRTMEQERAARATHIATAEAGGSHTIVVSGPATKGSTIHVAGRVVQLPSDAYVDRYIVEVLCAVNDRCPQTPICVLRRGGSGISVSVPSGRIIEERIAPGEEGAFDFLKAALR